MLIYVITDRRLRPDLSPEDLIDMLCRSGADMIQIREKDASTARLLAWTRRAVAAGGAGGRPEVFVNGRADVALAAGARGVHLPADGLPVADATSRWARRLRVGVSVHSPGEARAAESAGAGFVTFGPVFETASKRAFGAPQGVGRLAEVVGAVRLPVFAIGGIDPSRMPDLAGLPLAGVAVISAVLSAPDAAVAVAGLRSAA